MSLNCRFLPIFTKLQKFQQKYIKKSAQQRTPEARSGARGGLGSTQVARWRGPVRPDMRYWSRSRCFHPDPGTKHISVPPRHMTTPYASDFQHDNTTLQIQDTTSHTIGIQLPQI